MAGALSIDWSRHLLNSADEQDLLSDSCFAPKARVFRLAGNMVAVSRKRKVTPEWIDGLVAAGKGELLDSLSSDSELRDRIQAWF